MFLFNMADKTEPHVCSFEGCNKTFKKRSRLQSHYLSHTGERPHMCKFEGCNKSFKRVDHLSRHRQLQHESGEARNFSLYRCEESDCEAAFSSVYSLKKHVSQHHEKDQYKCHVGGCGAVFHKHHLLKSHKLEAHKQGKALCCTVPGCSKSFPTPNKLKRHLKVHEGYSCTEIDCGKKFDKWTLLVKHKKVEHSSVHKCQTCEKVFSQKQWLRQHMLTHSEERIMYMCYFDNCGRGYLDQRNLKAHIRSYHDSKKFPCEHDGCSQTFATKQKLKQHDKMHDPSRPLPKKPRKKKSKAEKLLGVSMVTESRGQDHVTLFSPDREDSIELPDLSHLHKDSSDTANTHITADNMKEEYIDNSELAETIYKSALHKIKSEEYKQEERKSENTGTDNSSVTGLFNSSVDNIKTEKCSTSDEGSFQDKNTVETYAVQD